MRMKNKNLLGGEKMEKTKIEITYCKDCVFFIENHCSMWNRATAPLGYCHNAEREVTESE